MRSMRAAAVVLLPCVVAVGSLSAEQHCDSSLPRDPGYALGYQLRGDRCEGVYIRNVSESNLQIASFTALVEPFDPKSVKTVRLQWTPPGPEPVHLRAASLTEKQYYRMDSLRPAGASIYDWPTEILAALRLSTSELGLLTWVFRNMQGTARAVYLPVSVGRLAGAASQYEVLLVPGGSLKSVYMTLAALRADGSTESTLLNGQTFRSGYWPAGTPLKIPLPVLKRSGLYYLEIGAALSTGGPATTEMWFYHSGDRQR